MQRDVPHAATDVDASAGSRRRRRRVIRDVAWLIALLVGLLVAHGAFDLFISALA